MLAVPDVLITAVGTQIWYLREGMRAFHDPTEVEWIEDKKWANRLDEGWDLQQVNWRCCTLGTVMWECCTLLCLLLCHLLTLSIMRADALSF